MFPKNLSTHTSLKKILALMLTVGIISAGLCRPAYAQDAGDAAYVQQIIPLLLGRKPKGFDEVKVLTDLTAAIGREAMLRTVMAQPEFVDHWAEHFVDQLRVHRETAKAQTTCFGPGHRTTSDGGALARWVLEHAPNSGVAPGGAFNMTDLLRSSIELDNLAPVYMAYLFALVDKPPSGNEISQQNKRDDLGVTFGNVYLHRQMLCLSCHNSGYSISGEDTHWDRTHPVWGAFETSLYGSQFGRDIREAHAVFRTAVRPVPDPDDPPDASAPLLQPWGMQDCGSFKTTVPTDPLAVDAYFTANFGRTGSIWNVETSLRNGYNVLARDGLIRSNPDSDGDGVRDTLNNDAAFAFVVATNIVNQTWSEIMGSPLTIPNYYPRNARQLATLWILTEFHFVPRGWSLKELLVKILTSEFFNRLPPQTTTATTPYTLPMLFDPWFQNDPRFPPEALPGWMPSAPPVPDPAHVASAHPDKHQNAMTESIHRYSPRSLLYSVSRALDWPAPRRFPTGSYPDEELSKSIGQFFKDAEPGFRSVDFQGLLQWESVHGACEKPTGVGTDWINRLITAIPTFDAAHAGSPATLEDLVFTMKDWLISDGRISTTIPTGQTTTEAATLQTLFGSPLTTRASTVPMLEPKLRSYCGVLLETPDFMLGGVTPPGGATAPRLRVCNGGPCTYAEICNAYRPAAERITGRTITCSTGSITATASLGIGIGSLAELCPPGRCSVIPWRGDLLCLRDPLKCRRTVPMCDPRCARIDCCGGPGPMENNIMLAWAEGARIESTAGVEILPNGERRYLPLKRGRVLKAGDILRIKSGAQLSIAGSKQGRFKLTQYQSRPEQLFQSQEVPLLFMVTGESALKTGLDRKKQRAPTKAKLQKVFREQWQKFGEAGPPVPPGTIKLKDPDRLKPRKPRDQKSPN